MHLENQIVAKGSMEVLLESPVNHDANWRMSDMIFIENPDVRLCKSFAILEWISVAIFPIYCQKVEF